MQCNRTGASPLRPQKGGRWTTATSRTARAQRAACSEATRRTPHVDLSPGRRYFTCSPCFPRPRPRRVQRAGRLYAPSPSPSPSPGRGPLSAQPQPLVGPAPAPSPAARYACARSPFSLLLLLIALDAGPQASRCCCVVVVCFFI
jgi:hypothetical protein